MKKIFFVITCFFISGFLFGQNSEAYAKLFKKGDSLGKAKDYKNAAITYSGILRLPGEKLSVWDWDCAGFLWSLSGNRDSAFYCLNMIAIMDTLSFQDCEDVITDPDYKLIADDKRWEPVKEKMFSNLTKKYIPNNAFARTKKSNKQMLIDGGHYNGHGINGTYAILAGTLRKNGFKVSGFEGKFEEASLKNTDILLISNPQPDRFDSLVQRSKRANQEFRWADAATQSAYTISEISVIENWVKNGGSLFLILDHAPFGKTGGTLAAAFGVECRNVGTYDSLSRDLSQPYTPSLKTIIFTRRNGLIGKHPILYGVDSVTTYTGESLMGPAKSELLLILPSTATDLDWIPETREFRNRPSLGRSQGVAFGYGRGRVVVFGEAAMINSESISHNNRGNWKFILNTIRWLAREKMD